MSKSNLVELLSADHPEAAAHTHTDSDAAFAFLKTAARIKSNMTHFTEQWTKLRPKRLKNKEIKDRDVLKGLAGLMAEGKLRVRSQDRLGGSGGEEDTPAKPPPPAPRPRKRAISGSGMKIRERPDPAPPKAPPPPMDVAKQVEALINAAKSGSPFVEQCDKAT